MLHMVLKIESGTFPPNIIEIGQHLTWLLLKEQESHAVAGKPRDAAVNSDRYRVRWHFAGAISVSRMQSVSGCTVSA